MKKEIKTFESEVIINSTCQYFFYSPLSIKRNKKYPLIITLHGAGERENIEKVESRGIPKYLNDGNHVNSYVLAPICSQGQWWEPEKIKPLIDLSIQFYPIDLKQIHITGYSMGGFGAWSMYFKYPNFFASLTSVCGSADPYAIKKDSTPVWLFHGEKDEIVPIIHLDNIEKALIHVNYQKFKVTRFKNMGHDIWDKVYNDSNLVDWILNQKRSL